MSVHAFGPLPPTPRIRRIGVLDIETWGLDARPTAFALGVYLDEHGPRRFTTRQEMVDFLLSRNTRGRWLWAHNGGRFDYLVLFGNFLRDRPKETLMVGGRAIALNIHEANGANVHRFCDSLNLIPRPLSAIGEAMGYPKGTTPAKFKEARREEGIAEEDWAYCERDCGILYRALNDLQTELGELAPTLPSLAMKLYRRHHMEGVMWIDIENDTASRAAYYGGRTEAYYIGRLAAAPHYYDVNSLYPHAMVTARFPDPRHLKMRDRALTAIPENEEGVAWARVTIPADCYLPPLPYRSGGKLMFPAGAFSGAWTFNELRLVALAGGQIATTRTFSGPSLAENPFRSYVEEMYEHKRVKTGFAREVYKLLLNGLYGKFGELHREQTEYAPSYTPASYNRMSGLHSHLRWKPISAKREDGFWAWDSEHGGRANHSIYVWAAYISAAARAINWRTQMLLRSLGIHTLYTDTDSFITDGTLLTDLPIPELAGLVGDGLGQLKVEDKIVTAIWGAKHYETTEGLTLKGVRRGATRQEDGSYRFASVVGARSAIRRNIEAGAPLTISRTPRHDYDKRLVLPNGDTAPWVVNE